MSPTRVQDRAWRSSEARPNSRWKVEHVQRYWFELTACHGPAKCIQGHFEEESSSSAAKQFPKHCTRRPVQFSAALETIPQKQNAFLQQQNDFPRFFASARLACLDLSLLQSMQPQRNSRSFPFRNQRCRVSKVGHAPENRLAFSPSGLATKPCGNIHWLLYKAL